MSVITMNGHTLRGEAVRRSIPVCGPAAFVVLKSFAFPDRGEPKDAYDLVYVLRRWPGGASDIACRLASHAKKHPTIVEDALGKLATDFATAAHHGPRRAAAFQGGGAEDLDEATADAHGYVDDLLRACRTAGLDISEENAVLGPVEQQQVPQAINPVPPLIVAEVQLPLTIALRDLRQDVLDGEDPAGV